MHEQSTEDFKPALNGKASKTSKKVVPIKQHKTLTSPDGELLTTLSLIKLISDQKVETGLSTSQMRTLWKALDKVDECPPGSTVIEFDTEEAKILLMLSKNFKFTIADRFFTDFEDSVS